MHTYEILILRHGDLYATITIDASSETIAMHLAQLYREVQGLHVVGDTYTLALEDDNAIAFAVLNLYNNSAWYADHVDAIAGLRPL